MRLSRPGEWEILTLMTLCALDMYTTLWWVLTGAAVEANPFLAWTFQVHPVVFVGIKTATFLPALLLARLFTERRPSVAVPLLRAVLIAYVGLYLLTVQ